jgi:hypothetical protein
MAVAISSTYRSSTHSPARVEQLVAAFEPHCRKAAEWFVEAMNKRRDDQ